MEREYPFLTDYAKSDRSKCKLCKNSIKKDALRMAVMIQSALFDGKMTAWFHFDCFFKKNKLHNMDDVKNIDILRWEDREKIKSMVFSSSNGSVEYGVEYVKAKKGCKCAKCSVVIEKENCKIYSKTTGSVTKSYHVDCFIILKDEILKESHNFEFNKLTGLNNITQKDLEEITDKFKHWISKKRSLEIDKEESEGVAKKHFKKEEDESSNEDLLKHQNDIIWQIRDGLEKEIPKSILTSLLEYNDQYVPSGESRILNCLSDLMAFGCLNKCLECGGYLTYENNGYKCKSNINEWTKCLYETKEVTRSQFKIPKEYQDYKITKTYKYVPRDRILVPQDSQDTTMAINTSLEGYRIGIAKVTFNDDYKRSEIQKKIKNLGGIITKSITKTTAVLITNDEKEIEGKDINLAKTLNIDVVPPDFLDCLTTDDFVEVVKKFSVGDWGRSKEDLVKMRKSAKRVENVEKKIETFTIKEGAVVDPESKLDKKAHIYRDKGNNDLFNVILGMVDLVKGSNSFYKLQLLESDTIKKWWIFRSWGRIGTDIGSNKIESFSELSEAIESFEDVYLDKTGNQWSDRHQFQKQPHRFYPIDVDYGHEICEQDSLIDKKSLYLPSQVEKLIRFVFDLNSMKKAMMEFSIDLKKMPLGKLSTKQIELSYNVLNELNELLTASEAPTKSKLLDASTRFYTLLPHDFGMKAPPLLDSLELIKLKCDMIDNLMEIEIAYNMLKSKNGENNVDNCYQQLHNRINTVERGSDIYKRIEKYLTNSHGSTHSTYSISIEEIFDLERDNEGARFAKFSKLHNHMMLWHGSRRTNWAGILSQGLRIAPPEAPVSGYMFGKGIYFADSVSKSANYCRTSGDEPEALLLLCEVALGNMAERYNADSNIRLSRGENSCKGVGATSPDPKGNFVDKDGVMYPLGTAVTSQSPRGSLQYNEYIVYDVSQVKQRYLLKVKFKYN